MRTYSPLPAGNAPQSELFGSLTKLAVGLLELPAGHDMVGIVRGSFGVPDHPYGIVFDENTTQSEHFRAIVYEREIDPRTLWTARDGVRWRDETGPVWDDGGARVRLASSLDQHLLYQHEVCINEEISFPMPNERIRRGIQRVVTHSERHGHLTMFDRGAYLIAERSRSPLGSAWCFRSFDPATCGWIVWVRRPYVREGYRKKVGYSVDVFDSIIRASAGLFAEAGYPRTGPDALPPKFGSESRPHPGRIFRRRGRGAVHIYHLRAAYREPRPLASGSAQP